MTATQPSPTDRTAHHILPNPPPLPLLPPPSLRLTATPTNLQLTELDGNSLTSTVPTQLGKLVEMEDGFLLEGNHGLCGYLPTQLAALSSQVVG